MIGVSFAAYASLSDSGCAGGSGDWARPPGRRPARLAASLNKYSICALTLRNSSAAHRSRTSYNFGSMRSGKLFLTAIADRQYRLPVLMTGLADRSDTIATIKLLIMDAFRSSSS